MQTQLKSEVEQPPLSERSTFLSVTGAKEVTLYYIARPITNPDLFAHERLRNLPAECVIDGEAMLVDTLTHEQFVELYFRNALDPAITMTTAEVKRNLLQHGFRFKVHVCYFAHEVREALTPPSSLEE